MDKLVERLVEMDAKATRAREILSTGKLPETVEKRVGANVIVMNNGCWEWSGRTDKDGYGRVTYRSYSFKAATVLWFIKFGEIPRPGLVLDHFSCSNRRCVNPEHLRAVTVRENALRGETVSAINAAKTHCPRGHAYSHGNTYLDNAGRRHCRACRKPGSK